MAQPNKIFLSYSSGDRGFCRQLAEDLEGHGLEVWWDLTSIRVGVAVSDQIKAAIQECRWFGVILSPQAVASHWVGEELAVALALERSEPKCFQVLPLLRADCTPPRSLVDRAHADFRQSYEDGLRMMLQRIGSPVAVKLEAMLLSERPVQIQSAWARVQDADRSRYRTLLIRKLESEVPAERRAALTALWIVQDRHAAGFVARLLEDPDSNVVQCALRLAGESRSRSFLPAVAARLSHPNPGVRHAARQAEARIGQSKR